MMTTATTTRATRIAALPSNRNLHRGIIHRTFCASHPSADRKDIKNALSPSTFRNNHSSRSKSSTNRNALGESVQNNDSARDDFYASFCRGWHARRVESGAAFGIGRCQLGLDVCEYLPFVAPTRTRAFTKSRRNTQIYREK